LVVINSIYKPDNFKEYYENFKEFANDVFLRNIKENMEE